LRFGVDEAAVVVAHLRFLPGVVFPSIENNVIEVGDIFFKWFFRSNLI